MIYYYLEMVITETECQVLHKTSLVEHPVPRGGLDVG